MTNHIEAFKEKDRIIVSGSGPKLLVLKNTLSEYLAPEDILFSRSRVSFRFRFGVPYEDLLDGIGCRTTAELREEMREERRALDLHIAARNNILRIQEEGITLTGSAFWDRTLKPHQGIATNSMISEGLQGLCLFDEQGTGKTLSTIAAFDILKTRKEIEVLFVIGQKSFLGSWKLDFDRFIGNKYTIIRVEGNREQKFKALQKTYDVFLINYESIIRLLTPLKSIAREHEVMLVLDESYLIKNPSAKRSVSVRELSLVCKKSFVLCGTPSPNKSIDIVNQFDIADKGYTFSNFIPSEIEEVDHDEIMNRIEQRGVYLRRTKDEILPYLPPKKFNIVEVDMTGKQKSLYEKAREELILFLKNLDNTSFRRNLSTYFQRRAALLQICVSAKLIDNTYDETPIKYLELDKYVDSIVKDQQKKLVIWSVYTRSLDELEARYSEHGVARIDGTVLSSSRRSELISLFQNDPGIKMFIGNPAAAGAGITLHAAADCVYLSFSNQAAHYLQSLDRIHRIGQKSSEVNYHFIVCRNTLEIPELKRISSKEHRQKDLLGDDISETITVSTALAELGL